MTGWVGLDNALTALTGLGRVVVGALPGAAEAGAAVLVEAVEENAPEDRGFLKRTVGHGPESAGANEARHVVHVLAFYAGFLERGTSKMRARPFVGPQVDKLRELAMKQAVEDEVTRQLSGYLQ